MKIGKFLKRHGITILILALVAFVYQERLNYLMFTQPLWIPSVLLFYMILLGIGELFSRIFYCESLQEFSEKYANFLQDDSVKVRLDEKEFLDKREALEKYGTKRVICTSSEDYLPFTSKEDFLKKLQKKVNDSEREIERDGIENFIRKKRENAMTIAEIYTPEYLYEEMSKSPCLFRIQYWLLSRQEKKEICQIRDQEDQ